MTGGIYTFSPGERQAVKRTQGFIDAVNENRPGDVYKYLTPELRNGISKEAFIENFKKERSYPYLTPLYFYLDEVKLSPDGKGGEAIVTVAARLPGEKMHFNLTYHGGKYYVEAFKDIVDGTYIEKFSRL
ncbi:hypothetical protein P6N53_00610 [Desulforamulus aquiferis]|uniref:Uncharacterized protein n=1 Tax=Desulforamulus aquiferis TaxID=1397668 RepID=A0AAW7Z7U7_9FIRM|nr:hypothetical protein [Desulforamulus aquiferis]